jgi:type IV pilus assembly protein PilF
MRKLFYSLTLVICCTLVACSANKATDKTAGNNGAEHPTTNLQEASQINVRLGLGYLQQGNYPRAKEKLLLAAQQNVSQSSYGALAYFYERTHDNKLAAEYYQKAIALAPENGAPHNNYGAYLCRTGEYVAGDQQFKLAVNDTKYVNSASAYENAGLCALLVPDKAKAKIYFEKALQQNPKLSTSSRELAELK